MTRPTSIGHEATNASVCVRTSRLDMALIQSQRR